MNSTGRMVLLALVGIAATAAAYGAALSAMPWVSELASKQMLLHRAQDGFWLGVEEGSLVFLCCLFGGLIQAAILFFSGNARPVIAAATLIGSAGALSLQVYAVALKDVVDYPFGGAFGLTSPWRSFTAGEFVVFVTTGFVVVGVCQALTVRSLALAVFWPAVWLIGGVAFVVSVSLRWPIAPTSSIPSDLIGSGAIFGLVASAWVFVPFGSHWHWPRFFPAPLASGIASIVLVALIVEGGLRANALVYGPIDDPGYFCNRPDLAPGPGISASIILQECAIGKTIYLRPGETVAIDLQTLGGIDTSTQWFSVGVSDTSLLVAELAPQSVRGPYSRQDTVAIFRAQRTGVATIHAVLKQCTANFGGGCDRGYLWTVTIQVA